MDSLTPRNSQNWLYVRSDISLGDLLEQTKKHFGEDVSLDDLNVGYEHFHARCIGYDLYDGADYDDYITIERI